MSAFSYKSIKKLFLFQKLVLDLYEFAYREDLEKFLNEHGDSIDNYTYIEDLEYAIFILLYGDDFFDFEEVLALLSDIGITEEELDILRICRNTN